MLPEGETARPYTSATMSQHIGKLCRSAVSSFLLYLLTDVGVSSGSASKENAAVTHMTAQPSLLTTTEPWHLLVTQTPAKEKAKEGETVVLNCYFNSPRRPSLTDLKVKWYKEDEKGQMDLLGNNVTVLPNNSRVFMSGDLSQGDASLVILNVTISDHGIYFCEVTLPDGKVVTGDGTKLRIRRALGLFGIEESIGTIIGVVAAGIGGVVVLIIVLTPQLRRCVLCMRQGSRQDQLIKLGKPDIFITREPKKLPKKRMMCLKAHLLFPALSACLIRVD
ncbi:synaptogenesis protein syg-1 isoform x2 [Limosa lapponica baueri]|uniref:Synaptogenesis protein syg-1 isoform x2 n=1 Tax=Limosa lapponica baueri TaxID=1758121 RepID=A0A2I0TPU9_LIMLA|nr:synaptogenesis protein syg-1 isoform x2 [Limosa lapponica baueri]